MTDQKEQYEKLKEYINKARNRCLGAVAHVEAANYDERVIEANKVVDKTFDTLLRNLPIPLYLKTGELTSKEMLTAMDEAKVPLTGVATAETIAKAAIAKFIDIRAISPLRPIGVDMDKREQAIKETANFLLACVPAGLRARLDIAAILYDNGYRKVDTSKLTKSEYNPEDKLYRC